MGKYFNPGNSGFQEIINTTYVDKTGLISLINKSINTKDKLTCISRPRRFGKSYAAQMLSAYYDCSCDSSELFEGLKISRLDGYRNHLNKYNVIYLDITGFISELKSKNQSIDDITVEMKNQINNELCQRLEQLDSNDELTNNLLKFVEIENCKFVFIIDEWDALVREAKENERVQESYFNFLRSLFKNGNFTPKVVAAAYMTGILPIKKYGHQSAISDFKEYTMTLPAHYAEYVGFTNEDISTIVDDKYTIEKLKKWYDGYYFKNVGEIYNPNSVMEAIKTGEYASFWSKSETYEALLDYINSDADGLKTDLIQMLGGNEMEVDISTFQNDMVSVQTRNDILSLLIHLGYLAYNSETRTVRIPNEEIRQEFISTIRNGRHDVTNKIIANSDKLIQDVIDGNETEVAAAIQEAHDAGTFGAAPLFYNDEQALRAVVKFAFISCANEYLKFEELPSGHGYADLVYIPKPKSILPPLLIELKIDEVDTAAIKQIKEKNHPKVLENIGSEIVLCGITYNSKSKQHSCKIEKYRA